MKQFSFFLHCSMESAVAGPAVSGYGWFSLRVVNGGCGRVVGIVFTFGLHSRPAGEKRLNSGAVMLAVTP